MRRLPASLLCPDKNRVRHQPQDRQALGLTIPETLPGLWIASALPSAMWAQQRERMRRIGALAPTADSDPEWKERVSGFMKD
jgi:hypothetical protein